jgi:enterochelin esterase-like enzyme
MKKLTHQLAQRMIQTSNRTPEEDQALLDHIAGCAECSSYYQMDRLLAKHLHVSPVRQQPTRQQQQAIIEQSTQQSGHWLPRFGFDLAGAAVMVIIIFIAWISLRDAPIHTEIEPTLKPTVGVSAPARGQQVTVNVPAPSLADSSLLNPDEQTITLYLPPSYDISEKHYPVVYFLPKGEGDLLFLETFLYSGIRDGELAEMILVSINEPMGIKDSVIYFVNSPATGNLSDFILEDVVSYVDANYRTLPEAASRAIAGHYTGGFSALNIAWKDQDTFGVLYTIQPTVFESEDDLARSIFTNPGVRSRVLWVIEQLGSMSAEEARAELQQNKWFRASYAVGYGLAFAPTPDASPPFFNYPYLDPHTRAPQAVWDQWLDGIGNLEDKVAAAQENLEQLEAIGIGAYDSRGSGFDSTAVKYLSEVMTAAGIPYSWHESDNVGGALQKTLPFLNEHLLFQ